MNDMASGALLRPDDTFVFVEDALPGVVLWGKIEFAGVDKDAEEVTGWCAKVREDESHHTEGAPGVVAILDHEVIVNAMRRIVAERERVLLGAPVVDQIAAVLDAGDRDTADAEANQLDVIGFDAIVQMAAFGQVVYG